MEEKILSISVASYNLKEMIEDNINSFVNAKLANKIELIIVDDGSKDNTPNIIEEYAKKYPTIIKFIKKVNEGPGSTVNAAIKVATGKYFRMVDGDDWVDTNNLDEFISYLETINDDLVISDYAIFDNDKKCIDEIIRFDLKDHISLSFKESYKNIPNKDRGVQMHGLTFKTSIFKEHNITLDNYFYTDVQYMLYPMAYVNTVSYFNKTIYMYRVAQLGQSVSIPSMKKNISQHEKVLSHLLEFYEKIKDKIDEEHRYFIANRISIMCDVQLGTYLYFDVDKNIKKTIKTFIKSLKREHKDIYKLFKISKKLKLLIYSNYLLYPYLSKKYTKMMSE